MSHTRQGDILTDILLLPLLVYDFSEEVEGSDGPHAVDNKHHSLVVVLGVCGLYELLEAVIVTHSDVLVCRKHKKGGKERRWR